MTYIFREVEQNKYGFYDYVHSKFVEQFTDTSDFCNILNIMKDTKTPIKLHKYNNDIGYDDVYTYTIVHMALTMFESYYEEPNCIMTVYIVNPNGAED
jgi:hypothetical protein